MVRNIVSLLYAPVRGLHEAAYLLGIFALGSQLLALVRDRVLLSTFGAGSTLDLYYAAFRLPDLLFALIASLVSVYVLIPLISRQLNESHEEARQFLAGALTFFTVTIGIGSGLAFLFAPHILPWLYPGFSDAQISLLTTLTRIILLQPVLLGVSNLFATITQLRQRFLVYAISPLLYNIGIIIGVVWLYPLYGPSGLAFGVVLGALLHLFIQVPYLLTDPITPRFFGTISWQNVREIISISLPRTLALSAQQLALAALLAIASLSAVGSITVFSTALNLQSVPLAIIGVSYSVAAFPTLSRLFSEGNKNAFFAQISTASRHIIFWSFPVIALFVVLRAQIVRVIFGTGAFDWADTRLTAAALAVFVLSLAANGLVLLLVRGYYAAGNTRKPLLINLSATALGVVTSVALLDLFRSSDAVRGVVESILRVEGLPGTEVVMLALGYSLGVILNAVMLIIVFERDFSKFGPTMWSSLWKSFLGAIAAGSAAYVGLQILDEVFDLNTFVGIFAQGLGGGVIGISACVLVLWLLKSTELEEALGSATGRIFRTKTVVPEQNG